jgi:hypothetical protein
MNNKSLWIGRVLSGLMSAFLLLDSGMKMVKAAPAVKGTIDLGYPDSVVVGIGIALFISTILYLIPRTAVLGAIFLTGYLGGAVASQVRVGNPVFSHILFPVYVAIVVWLGIYLRDAGLSTLLSLRRATTSDARPVLLGSR